MAAHESPHAAAAVPADAADDAQPHRFSARLAPVLRHPLTISLVAGAIAALVFPLLTRQWQDHQRELQLKQELVDQIATSGTTAIRSGVSLVSGQLGAAGGSAGSTQSEIYAALRNRWLIDRAGARASIVTYFPGLQPCWHEYELVTAYFLGLVDRNPSARATKARAIRRYAALNADDGCVSLDALPAQEQRRYRELRSKLNWNAFEQLGTTGFRNAYAILAEMLEIGQDRVIKSIVSARAASFYHGPFGLFD